MITRYQRKKQREILRKKGFDIIVEIRTDFKKCQPFEGLQSRLPVVTVFAYMGFNYEVMPILQQLSHKTRAYAFNANGFKGFLMRLDPITFFRRSEVKCLLNEVTQYQVVDLPTLKIELDKYSILPEKLKYLSIKYPCLYIFFLE